MNFQLQKTVGVGPPKNTQAISYEGGTRKVGGSIEKKRKETAKGRKINTF